MAEGTRWDGRHSWGLVPQILEQDHGHRFRSWIHPWVGQQKTGHRSFWAGDGYSPFWDIKTGPEVLSPTPSPPHIYSSTRNS